MFSLSSLDSVHDGLTYVPWAGYVANYPEFGSCGAGPYRDSLHQNLVLNEWNHIAITFDRGHLRGYYNGQKMYDSVTVVEYANLGEYNTDDIFIGRYWKDVAGYRYFGALDEIKIYDRALTLAEIEDYYDAITAIDKNGQFSTKVFEYKLHQNYPNPFNPTTTINWQVAVGSKVELSVYNILGQKVITLVDQYMHAGQYQVEWNGANFSSGVYFYRLDAGNYSEIRKMILLK
jgi:hypothetical protein